MIIYKCVITGDEMFSDIYKIKESECGTFYEVEGKYISRTEGIDDALIGANASAEEVHEGSEDSTSHGVDIVMNHKLQQTGFDKKHYMTYVKQYVKTIRNILMEKDEERAKAFVACAQKGVPNISSRFKDFEFFTGESMDPDGMVALMDFREDGTTPFMLFFKEGLLLEKC